MLIKFIVFGLVGVVGTSVHYLILYQLVESHGISPVIASGWGAFAGLIVNYLLNYALTFKSQQSHRRAFPKFALIAGIGFSLNMGLMALLIGHLYPFYAQLLFSLNLGLTATIYYLYAQILTTLLVLIWNFLGNSLWTFKAETV